MVRISRILRDYQDAGSVNGLLSLWGFVDDWTFLTKAGHVGLVYHLRGVDYEGLSHPQRHALVHRFEAGLRLGVDFDRAETRPSREREIEPQEPAADRASSSYAFCV